TTRPRRGRTRARGSGRRRSRWTRRRRSSSTAAGPSIGSGRIPRQRTADFGRVGAGALEPGSEHPHVPGPSLWPVGFAIGVVVLLIGVIVGWPIVILGAVLSVSFAFLWVRDLAAGSELTVAPPVDAEKREQPTGAAPPAPVGEAGMPEPEAGERFPRSKFLELSTLGLGGVIGGLVTVPALGFM